MKLRLHGTRLPRGYTISMRLPPYSNVNEKRPSLGRKRRRRRSHTHSSPTTLAEDGTTSEDFEPGSSPARGRSPGTSSPAAYKRAASADNEDEQTRLTNAYPGASNSIGSVHQRQWFLTFDRVNSGFVRTTSMVAGNSSKSPPPNQSPSRRTQWVRNVAAAAKIKKGSKGEDGYTGFEPFYVMGPNIERSVVTGRTAADVMADEGVTGWVGRKGWKPALE